MNRKKTLMICVAIILVSVLVSGINMFFNRSTSRAPTQEEIDTYAPYTIDWTAAGKEEGMTEKDFILSLCVEAGEEEIGENVYQTYTSDSLGNYLYKCEKIEQITMSADNIFYVSYTDTDGRTVIMSYNDDGFCEKGIYEPEADTFYHEYEGNVEVWTKFTTGIQWGS